MNLKPEILKLIVLDKLVSRDTYGKIVSDEQINHAYDSMYYILRNYMDDENFKDRVDNLLTLMYFADLIKFGNRDCVSGEPISIRITTEGINFYKCIEQI